MNERVYNGGVDRLRSADRVSRLEVDKVVDNCLNGNNIKSVLDVGTGSGLFAEEFSRKGIKVAAIDPNSAMVQASKSVLPGIDIREASAENIPFEANSFDAAFMGLVLHEVNDYKQVLSELYRVAEKEAYILEWEYKTQDFGPPLEHRLKEEFIRQTAKDAGFKNVKVIKLTSLLLYKLYK